MMLFRTFLLSFLVTAVSEGLAAALLGLRSREDQSLVFLVNLLTNPAAVYLNLLALLCFGYLGQMVSVVVIEGAVVLVEAFVYRRHLFADPSRETLPRWTKRMTGPGAALALSLLLNAVSYGAGEAVQRLLI